jgi:hypothetical protein
MSVAYQRAAVSSAEVAVESNARSKFSNLGDVASDAIIRETRQPYCFRRVTIFLLAPHKNRVIILRGKSRRWTHAFVTTCFSRLRSQILRERKESIDARARRLCRS